MTEETGKLVLYFFTDHQFMSAAGHPPASGHLFLFFSLIFQHSFNHTRTAFDWDIYQPIQYNIHDKYSINYFTKLFVLVDVRCQL